MTPPRWSIQQTNEQAVDRLRRELGVSPTLARLLAQRGLVDPQEARRFLNPSLSDLRDPFLLPAMDAAVARLAAARERGEKVLIHGDYDVDGLTSAALLYRGLAALGFTVESHIPHRSLEGYDLQIETVERVAREGVKLIVTTDCGTGAVESVLRARELGVDVVVTDHHQPGPRLAPAAALVNPHLEGSAYPFPDLCAAAVALKVLCALTQTLGHPPESAVNAFLDLAALGTAADLMPLVDENRAIVKFGLQALDQTRKLGLLALMQVAGCYGRPVTAYDLSFVLGPRLNAVGRVDDARLGLELLVTRDEARALELARKLEEMNRQRRLEQARVLREALQQVSDRELADRRVLVVSGEGWHAGVIGLVASKIVEAYNRPAIVISAVEGTGRASCRSQGDFDIMEALNACRDLLLRCGGHQGAAGFDIDLTHLQAFEDRINGLCPREPGTADAPPDLCVDLELRPDQIGDALLQELALLEPFGTGNPEPLFSSTLTVLERRRVGADGSHLRLSVRGEGMPPTVAIAFRHGDWCRSLEPGMDVDLCYRLRQNSYNGRVSLQLMVEDLRAAAGCPSPMTREDGTLGDPFRVPEVA